MWRQLFYVEYMVQEKQQTLEGIELSVDRFQHVFVKSLLVWTLMDGNCPLSLLEFLDSQYWSFTPREMH